MMPYQQTISSIWARCGLSLLLLGLMQISCQAKEKSSGTDAVSGSKQLNAEKIDRFDDPVPVTKGDAEGGEVDKVVVDEDLNRVLAQCGIDDLSDNNRETFSTIMDYKYIRHINAGIATADVNLRSILNLRGTLGETTLDVGVEVGALSGTSEMGAVTDTKSISVRAENLAKSFRGPVTSFSAPRNANFTKEWKGILCSISAADSLRNTRGGFKTEVKFDPAYAPAISPIATKERYEKELGDYRIFRNIKATITSTNNPLLKADRVLIGNIIVEKIPPTKETPAGLIQGDTAFRITNHFGTDAETLAMGFHLWTEYYLDHSQKAFSAVIANVGDEEIMHFIGTYKGGGKASDTQTASTSTNPTYEKDVGPLLAQKCTGCHGASSSGRQDLSTFAKAKANAGTIRDRIVAGTMPPGAPLSSTQKKLVQDWVSAGSVEK